MKDKNMKWFLVNDWYITQVSMTSILKLKIYMYILKITFVRLKP